MYVERHLTTLIENYHPSKSPDNLERMMKEIEAGRSFVHTLVIQQLPSHIDLSQVFSHFPNLLSIDLKYGMRKLGMDYDTSSFGMQLLDAMGLAKYFLQAKTLNRVALSENLLNDESIHVLMSGLARNDTITYLGMCFAPYPSPTPPPLSFIRSKNQPRILFLNLTRLSCCTS
jgi:hypothetical protein